MPALSLILYSSIRTGLQSQTSLCYSFKYPSYIWLNLIEISSLFFTSNSMITSSRLLQSTFRLLFTQPGLQKPITAYQKWVKMSYYLTLTSPLLCCWQRSKVYELYGLIMVYSFCSLIFSRQKTCRFLRSSSPFLATKVIQLFFGFASSSLLTRLLLLALNSQLQAGMPVISSKASSGESPLALSQDPICLHHPFSIINGHSSTPFTILEQMKASACVGILSSMSTLCFSPLEKKFMLYAPKMLVALVSMICFMSEPRGSWRQRKQQTHVRQQYSMFNWMKLVMSGSALDEQILAFMASKLKRTDNLEHSFESTSNLSSSKYFSLFSSIFLATIVRLFSWKD